MNEIKRAKNHALVAAFVLMVCCAIVPNASAAVWFSDFSSTAGLTLNGSAASLNNGIDANNVLRLATATTNNGGSAFTNSTMDITSFSTSFSFRISQAGGITDSSGQTGADGIAFVIQPLGPATLGGLGGSLGYGGIVPSVAVELDTWFNGFDPDSNHIGIDTNGSLTSLITAPVPGQFDDGTLRSVSISYDGTTLVASSGGAMVSIPIDIPTLIGANSAYVGLTAATGGAFGDHDIIAWHFDRIIPEPGTFAIWSLLGLASAGACGRRRRR